MSYSNQTTHYGLPLPTASDRSVWTDNNTAFEAIDGAIYTASQNATGASEAVSAMATTVTGHTASISTLNADVATLSTSVTGIEGDLDTAESAIETMGASIATINNTLALCERKYVAGDSITYGVGAGFIAEYMGSTIAELRLTLPLEKEIDSNATLTVAPDTPIQFFGLDGNSHTISSTNTKRATTDGHVLRIVLDTTGVSMSAGAQFGFLNSQSLSISLS